ncbi:serine/threonine-protein kinase [Tumidithrix elongata RA019]|uniref:Serine/threonine-protein kinase n=1 Tax=Tumidithrix elongata BACA0141 TaxID=2716417 RepID=A0AAW9PS59_9CYAN|nr:serine/threonine-protein kinase [Tumidithrix elongata RA019]
MSQSQSSQFSKYRIIGLVGRGQFGRVLCARNRETKNLVALKELEQKRFPTSKLLRELRFLISLQHPNIVSCMSLVHSKNCRYLVMEYCASGTLRELIDHHYQLTPQQCIDLVIDILLGLEHAHNAKIIHCDLKPENVLLTLTANGWQAKLSDFGIARLSQEMSEENGAGNTGSPGYMAPERFYGQFSIASDIYAVGIILYELLLKDRPFTGKPSELMSAHMNQRVTIPDLVPRSLQAIITKALQKLPARRYTTARQMLEELQAIANSSEVIDLNLEPIARLNDLPTISLAEQADLLLWQNMSDRVVAIAHASQDGEWIYYATANQLQKQLVAKDLSFYEEEEFVAKFNPAIAAIFISKQIIFVITQRSIHRQLEGKWQTIYQTNQSSEIQRGELQSQQQVSQKFLWAISPEADWIAVAIDNSLEIKNLKYLRSVKLGFNQRTIHFLVPLDQHHLVAISNRTDTKDSRLMVISRRGNLMEKRTLPSLISQAIAGQPSNQLLLVEAKNPKTILLLQLKPYHITRIVLAYQPILIASTSWGYAITGACETVPMNASLTSDRAKIGKTAIILLDFYGQNLGCLEVEGEIVEIAAIGIQSLAISVIQNQRHRLCFIDLKELDIDLIF